MVRAHEWDVSRRLARPHGGRRPWWVTHPVPARSSPGLEWESAGAHAVVGVTGDVDELAAPQLEAFVAGRWLAGCAVLEIDLTGVRSMGSTGLSVLLGVHRWCEQRGIELRLRGTPPSVWRVFEATGLDGAFEPVATPAVRLPEQDLALF
jgi:anti-anti-sigma factor